MIEKVDINIENGLSNHEVNERIKEGRVNRLNIKNSKSYKQIIMDNTFTLFNLVNVVLAILVAFTGSFKNLFFIGIVILNVAIGIIQEIRAKKILDKITLLVSTKVKVIRDGKEQTIEMDEVVVDDISILSTGNQVVADSILKEGYLEVNESLLTGESDIVKKSPGDFIYSGSFITSGKAKVQVENVGEDNYASKISTKAKEFKKYKSEINDSLNKILKFVSIIILPLGITLFAKSYFINGIDLNQSILTTTAALIGMVPEGLILLTSISLAVGAINLAKKRTLVQELNCLESLARVDVLCLDKTGTITEGKMEVKDVVSLDKDYDVNEIMGNLVYALNDDNFTFLAIKDRFKKMINLI
ncbi:HAD-IC family P-type ATPase [Paraclostridium sordellii]|uniref:HAD-IC family P-type ATPase n=1 Tax=Paraclostridium sordellii TaxID=1505 RepID=UPI0005DEEE88|nr:HAD-IC family P-type ATPase [Paeniclostridium sordellii]CEP44151.1 cation-transporting ATPase [[Clostridium] sordellii] [Paeniclostridium sordellii]